MTASQAHQTLRSLIAQAQSDGTGLYWLLDQSALPQQGWLRRNVGAARWLDLLGGTSEATFNGASPVIVRAVGATTDTGTTRWFADELYRTARFANAVSLLDSPLPIDELQTTLRDRARIELPGKLEAVLRYFDTRTLPLLPRLLTQIQYAQFTDGIRRWSYLGRHGVVQCLPAAAPPPTVQSPAPSRLVLDETQEAMLIDDALTDTVIDLMLTQRHTTLLDLSPPEQFDVIDPLVCAARAAGLCEPFEALAFAAKALAEGADFSQREPWLGRLKQYREKQCSIAEAFA
jgi:hypothetical protein